MENNIKPLIGIVSKPTRYKQDPLWQYDELIDDFRYLMVQNGALAIGILPTAHTMTFNDNDDYDPTMLSQEELDDLYRIVDMCDGILLEGGIGSSAYEIEVAKYAIEQDKPLLGICAGFNNLIRATGGDVRYDPDCGHNVFSKEMVHRVNIEKDSQLFRIIDVESLPVNSIHVMIADDSDIKNLKITARSEDNLVEAVELDDKTFVIGIKWHPELMLDTTPSMNNIFVEFIAACRTQSNTPKVW